MQSGSWVKEDIKKEKSEFLEMNDNENTTHPNIQNENIAHPNIWNTMKASYKHTNIHNKMRASYERGLQH